MTATSNNKKRNKILYTTPITHDQKSVRASEKIFGSSSSTVPLREKPNVKRPKRKK